MEYHQVGGHLSRDLYLLGLQFCIHAEQQIMGVTVVTCERKTHKEIKEQGNIQLRVHHILRVNSLVNVRTCALFFSGDDDGGASGLPVLLQCHVQTEQVLGILRGWKLLTNHQQLRQQSLFLSVRVSIHVRYMNVHMKLSDLKRFIPYIQMSTTRHILHSTQGSIHTRMSLNYDTQTHKSTYLFTQTKCQNIKLLLQQLSDHRFGGQKFFRNTKFVVSNFR